MPVKNAQSTILRATNSILHQSLSNLELIIINDHSSDHSLEIISNIGDARINVLSNRGSGIAAALNTGIERAKGTYIARMDADDVSHPNRLHRQHQFMVDNLDIDVVSCLVEHNSIGSQQQGGYAHHIEWLNSILSPDDHYFNRFADAPLAHPTAFFKSDLPKKYGHYTTEPLPEDFELWLKWFEQGVRFAKVPETLFSWYDYPNRASRTNANYSPEKFFRLKANYFKRWWQKQPLQKEIWIWGYGKEVFKKSSYVEKEGMPIHGYYDIIERPQAKRNVLMYKAIKPDINRIILIYVADRTGKADIAKFFGARNMHAGKDYLFMT